VNLHIANFSKPTDLAGLEKLRKEHSYPSMISSLGINT
jgi:hypothetical protein